MSNNEGKNMSAKKYTRTHGAMIMHFAVSDARQGAEFFSITLTHVADEIGGNICPAIGSITVSGQNEQSAWGKLAAMMD